MRLTVGDDVMTPCGKCKQRTWHVVFAMDAGVVKRVQCKICMSYHNYRPDPEERAAQKAAASGGTGVLRRRGNELVATPASPSPPATPPEKRARAEKSPRAASTGKAAARDAETKGKRAPEGPDWEKLWNEALVGKDLTVMARYRAEGDFPLDSLLDHPQFGVGVVVKVTLPPERRMTVLFRDGQKLLMCRYGR